MKRSLVFIMLILPALVYTQVTIQPVVPAVGMLQKSQLWNTLIVNSSPEQYVCRIDLILRDRVTNLELFTASTNNFTVAKGAGQFNINSFNPVQYNYLSPGFDTKSQGLIPAGNYIVCYTVNSVGAKPATLADECIQLDVEPLSPPLLIAPADSTILEVAPAQFSWIPPTPGEMFTRLNYDIIITQVNEGQKAEEAIQQNIPFYSEGNLTASMLTYKASALKFEKDKWYAWQVVARDERNYAGKTETWVFKIGQGTKLDPPVSGVYLQLTDEAKGIYQISPGKLNLKYFSYHKEYSTRIIFTDDKGNIVKKEKTKIKQGENYLDFDLSGSFRSNTSYTVTLTDKSGKQHSLTFSINTK